jgi:serine/threonine protein kinase
MSNVYYISPIIILKGKKRTILLLISRTNFPQQYFYNGMENNMLKLSNYLDLIKKQLYEGISLKVYRVVHQIILPLAIQMKKIINKIHIQNVIHKAINSSHFLWNPNPSQIKVIDYGLSNLFSHNNK